MRTSVFCCLCLKKNQQTIILNIVGEESSAFHENSKFTDHLYCTQKWATRKGYSLRDKRPLEVSSLSMDEILGSRFPFIHMSQFARSLPRRLALRDGSNVVGPIALSSSDFAATNNRGFHVQQDQSGSTVSLYGRKNTRETSDRWGIIMSSFRVENLQQHFGCKHKDAVNRLGGNLLLAIHLLFLTILTLDFCLVEAVRGFKFLTFLSAYR